MATFKVLELEMLGYGDFRVAKLTDSPDVVYKSAILLSDYVKPKVKGSEPSFEQCLELISIFSKQLMILTEEGHLPVIAFYSYFIETDAKARELTFKAFIIAWCSTCPLQVLHIIAPSKTLEMLEKLPDYLEYKFYDIDMLFDLKIDLKSAIT